MKIVLDTNVLIAAFVAQGTCHELFEHCTRQHEVFVSDFILNEFAGVLNRKFDFTQSEIRQALEILNSRLNEIVVKEEVSGVSRDPDDDHILAVAVSAECDCIVSGDKDLLDLKKFEGIPIILPRDFWKFEVDHISQKGNKI